MTPSSDSPVPIYRKKQREPFRGSQAKIHFRQLAFQSVDYPWLKNNSLITASKWQPAPNWIPMRHHQIVSEQQSQRKDIKHEITLPLSKSFQTITTFPPNISSTSQRISTLAFSTTYSYPLSSKMSSRIYGPRTVTFELSAKEASCQGCIEDGLNKEVMQYEVAYVRKRNSYTIITTGDPVQLKAAILKHIAEEKTKGSEKHSQPKGAGRKRRTRPQEPKAQPRTRRQTSPVPPPPPPPTPQPSGAHKK